MTAHGQSRMTSLLIGILAGVVVVIGSSGESAAADVRGRCHQRCVDVFQSCTDQMAPRHGSAVACQRELEACQRTCR